MGRTESSGRAGRRRSARRAILACLPCANCPSCQIVADFSLVTSGKSPPHFRTSRLAEEGRFAIVTSVEPEDAMGVLLRSRVSQPGRRTERCDGEIVWSWHRGADAKPAVMIRRRRGQDSRSPRRARISCQTVAQGRPDIGLNLWFCRVLLVARGPRVSADTRSSLRLFFVGEVSSMQNSGVRRREIARPCLQIDRPKEGSGGDDVPRRRCAGFLHRRRVSPSSRAAAPARRRGRIRRG